MVAVATTVVIVDDHAAFRAAARALLEADGFDVIGEVATGTDALRAIDHLRPDVVLLDIQLPDVDGFVIPEAIAEASTSGAVILVSSRDRSTFGDRLEQSTARGFLDKAALSGDAITQLIA